MTATRTNANVPALTLDAIRDVPAGDAGLPALRSLCRAHGLSDGGVEAILRHRLTEHVAQTEAHAAAHDARQVPTSIPDDKGLYSLNPATLAALCLAQGIVVPKGADAVAMHKLLTERRDAAKATPAAPATTEPTPIPDDAGIKGITNRAALEELCTQHGIYVPMGSGQSALRKLLAKHRDAKPPAPVAPAPEPTTPPAPAPTPPAPAKTPAPTAEREPSPMKNAAGLAQLYVLINAASGPLHRPANGVQCLEAAFASCKTTSELEALMDLAAELGVRTEERVKGCKADTSHKVVPSYTPPADETPAAPAKDDSQPAPKQTTPPVAPAAAAAQGTERPARKDRAPKLHDKTPGKPCQGKTDGQPCKCKTRAADGLCFAHQKAAAKAAKEAAKRAAREAAKEEKRAAKAAGRKCPRCEAPNYNEACDKCGWFRGIVFMQDSTTTAKPAAPAYTDDTLIPGVFDGNGKPMTLAQVRAAVGKVVNAAA